VVSLLLAAIRATNPTAILPSSSFLPAAGVDAIDVHGQTSLHVAAAVGNTEAVELLLRNPNDPHNNNNSNVSSAALATTTSSSNASGAGGGATSSTTATPLPLLLSPLVASVHALALNGSTPLHTACVQGRSPSVVEALLRHGSDPLATDHARHSTPLHLAAAAGAVPCIEALLTHIRPQQQQLQELLQASVSETGAAAGHNSSAPPPSSSALLSRASLLLEAAGKKGFRPLHMAAASGQVEAVRVLAEWTIKVQQQQADAKEEGGDDDSNVAGAAATSNLPTSISSRDEEPSSASQQQQQQKQGLCTNSALSVRTDEGHTALSLACHHALHARQQAPRAVQVLIELGVDPSHDVLENCPRNANG
jgi:ankyrin repeat protein